MQTDTYICAKSLGGSWVHVNGKCIIWHYFNFWSGGEAHTYSSWASTICENEENHVTECLTVLYGMFGNSGTEA